MTMTGCRPSRSRRKGEGRRTIKRRWSPGSAFWDFSKRFQRRRWGVCGSLTSRTSRKSLKIASEDVTIYSLAQILSFQRMRVFHRQWSLTLTAFVHERRGYIEIAAPRTFSLTAANLPAKSCPVFAIVSRRTWGAPEMMELYSPGGANGSYSAAMSSVEREPEPMQAASNSAGGGATATTGRPALAAIRMAQAPPKEYPAAMTSSPDAAATARAARKSRSASSGSPLGWPSLSPTPRQLNNKHFIVKSRRPTAIA